MNIIDGFHNLKSENRGAFGEKKPESPELEKYQKKSNILTEMVSKK
jgi:hypothetical protein